MDDFKKDTSLNGSVTATADKNDRDCVTALSPEQDTSLVSQPEHVAAPSNESRKKAIVFMNIFALTTVFQSVIFKMASNQGAQVIDYQVFRNISLLFFSSTELGCRSKSPFKEFPSEQKYTLFWRCMTGQMTFFFFNVCLSLVPLTFMMIIFQTNSFWTSILAFCIFSEPIIPLEIIGMVVCFAGMVTITLSGANKASETAPDEVNYSSSQLTLGYLLVFLTSWIYASNCILNRALKGVHHAVVMFWHGVLGLILALSGVLIDSYINPVEGIRIFNYDTKVYMLMLSATLFESIAVNAHTIAFQSDSSGFVALIGYINILYAFMADSLILHEDFAWIEIVAALVILAVTVGTSIVKIRESRQAKLRKDDSFTSTDDFNRSMVKAD